MSIIDFVCYYFFDILFIDIMLFGFISESFILSITLLVVALIIFFVVFIELQSLGVPNDVAQKLVQSVSPQQVQNGMKEDIIISVYQVT